MALLYRRASSHTARLPGAAVRPPFAAWACAGCSTALHTPQPAASHPGRHLRGRLLPCQSSGHAAQTATRTDGASWSAWATTRGSTMGQALPLAGRVHLLSRGRGTGPRGRLSLLRGLPAVPLHRLRAQRGAARTWRSTASSRPFAAWQPIVASKANISDKVSRGPRGFLLARMAIENVLIQDAGDALYAASEAPQSNSMGTASEAGLSRRVVGAGCVSAPRAHNARPSKIGTFWRGLLHVD